MAGRRGHVSLRARARAVYESGPLFPRTQSGSSRCVMTFLRSRAQGRTSPVNLRILLAAGLVLASACGEDDSPIEEYYPPVLPDGGASDGGGFDATFSWDGGFGDIDATLAIDAALVEDAGDAGELDAGDAALMDAAADAGDASLSDGGSDAGGDGGDAGSLDAAADASTDG